MKTWSLGISAYYHDSAAALICDDQIIAAAQEERFTRKKHDSSFPLNAINFCMRKAGISGADLSCVVYYEKPFLKFERLLETYLENAPKGFRSFATAMPIWLKDKLFLKSRLAKELSHALEPAEWGKRLLFSEHHLSHAASAFYPSPFEDALILTMDGVGEWATTSVARGRGDKIEIIKEILFPHSIGLIYSAFTSFLGFKVNSGEYKVMGLAPYGEPRFAPLILEKMIDLKNDGSFRIDKTYFDYCTGLSMTNDKFASLFGTAARSPESPLNQFHMDLAASIQQVTETIVVRMVEALAKEFNERHLCLAGGVSLNCVANSKILRSGAFKKMWIQPAAGDAGGALGAAYVGAHSFNGAKRIPRASDSMSGSYLGPEFEQESIENELDRLGAKYDVMANDNDILEACAQALESGQAIGWFQGRMEFGPRALGARSIIADARPRTMQRQLNLKIKFRESFRPFAPAILAEDSRDWFETETESPYMLLVADVAENHRVGQTDAALSGLEKLKAPYSTIPAVTHVDGSARLQTVHQETNPLFHALLQKFKARTGFPVIVNTSFNVRGEPIVCSPSDAFRCFMGTDLDLLAIGRCILKKTEQRVERSQYHQNLDPD